MADMQQSRAGFWQRLHKQVDHLYHGASKRARLFRWGLLAFDGKSDTLAGTDSASVRLRRVGARAWCQRRLGGRDRLTATLITLLALIILLVPSYLLSQSLIDTAKEYSAIGGFILSGIIGLFVGAIIFSLGYKLFLAWLNEDTQAERQPHKSE